MKNKGQVGTSKAPQASQTLDSIARKAGEGSDSASVVCFGFGCALQATGQFARAGPSRRRLRNVFISMVMHIFARF